MASNLGYRTIVVADGTATFERRSIDNKPVDPEIIHQVHLLSLQGEFAEVLDADMVLSLSENYEPAALNVASDGMRPRKVGLIVFEHVAAADLTGPAEVFSRAHISGNSRCESSCYNVLMLGITAQPCRTECGIVVKPHTDLASAPALDTVIIPGGTGFAMTK